MNKLCGVIRTLEETAVGSIRANAFQFAEFAGAPPDQKLAIARLRARPGGGFDPYAALRHAITQLHRDGFPADVLRAKLRTTNVRNVDLVYSFDKYLSWLGSRPFKWLENESPRAWSSPNVTVPITADVTLSLRGKTYVIKPYFKVNALDSRTADNVLHMLGTAYAAEAAAGARLLVLDIGRELPFFNPHTVSAASIVFLEAEAASFEFMVRGLQAQAKRIA